MNPALMLSLALLAPRRPPGPKPNLNLPEAISQTLTLSTQNTKLILRRTGVNGSRSYELKDHISSIGNWEWSVIDAQQKGRSTYILLDVDGPSSLGPGGHCGGGYESDLIWIRVHGNQIVGLNSEHYYSCINSIESDVGKSEFGKTWTSQYSVYSDRPGTHRKLIATYFKKIVTYSLEHPERGLWVEDGIPVPDPGIQDTPNPKK